MKDDKLIHRGQFHIRAGKQCQRMYNDDLVVAFPEGVVPELRGIGKSDKENRLFN